MAQPDFVSTPTLRVVAPKPRMTIYYALLIIALVAMLTACLFLFLEIRRFGGFGAIPGRVSSVEPGKALFHHGVHGGHRVLTTDSSVNSVPSVVIS
jgi:hypothetical protein